MIPYNPLTRIPEANEQDKIIALEICVRFFTASTLDDFATLIANSETQLQKRPEPFDVFELLYKSIQTESYERTQALYASNVWGNESQRNLKAVDLTPSSWRIELRDPEATTHEIEVKKDSDFHPYENPCFVIEESHDKSHKVFIDFDELNNMHKSKS